LPAPAAAIERLAAIKRHHLGDPLQRRKCRSHVACRRAHAMQRRDQRPVHAAPPKGSGIIRNAGAPVNGKAGAPCEAKRLGNMHHLVIAPHLSGLCAAIWP
jgi:hypothetical protein